MHTIESTIVELGGIFSQVGYSLYVDHGSYEFLLITLYYSVVVCRCKYIDFGSGSRFLAKFESRIMLSIKKTLIVFS